LPGQDAEVHEAGEGVDERQRVHGGEGGVGPSDQGPREPLELLPGLHAEKEKGQALEAREHHLRVVRLERERPEEHGHPGHDKAHGIVGRDARERRVAFSGSKRGAVEHVLRCLGVERLEAEELLGDADQRGPGQDEDDDEEGAGTGTGTGTGTQAEETAPAPTGPAAEKVSLSETEFKIDPADVDVKKSGVIEFEVTNDGSTTHALEVEGGDVEQRTDDIAPGESATLKVDLSKGVYEMYCPISNHKELGMTGELRVAGAAGPVEDNGGSDDDSSEDDSSDDDSSSSGY